MLQRVFFTDEIGMGPLIKVWHPESNRDKKQREHGDRSGCRFKSSACHDAPGACREVLHHDDSECTKRKSEPEQIAHQIGPEEVARIKPPTDARHDGEHYPDS